MSNRKANRRLIARDACTWCGHARHDGSCSATIRTQAKPALFGPCTCARALLHADPTLEVGELEEVRC